LRGSGAGIVAYERPEECRRRYALFAAVMLLLFYHSLLQNRVAQFLPSQVAAVIGWFASGLMLLLLLDNLLRSLRGRVRPV
jgi:hypothetical protein